LGVPLNMSRIHPECPDSTDVLLRQEPAEEEDEEEDEADGKKMTRMTKRTKATRSENARAGTDKTK
jgi:hypothetical protein